jgi:hypothetical protein
MIKKPEIKGRKKVCQINFSHVARKKYILDYTDNAHLQRRSPDAVMITVNVLKGQCHEMFCFWFFSLISFPPAPEYSIKTGSNFFENSRRYSQLKVCHRCQRHRWQMEKIFNQKNFTYLVWSSLGSRGNIYITSMGVNDTGSKFVAGVVDTGGNLPPASLTPAANLPPVSLIPVANLPPVSLIPVATCHRRR